MVYRKMQKNKRELWISGTVFLVLGTLLLIIHERVRLKVGVLPFSMVLTLVLVAGAVMFGIGVLSYFAERF